MAQLSLSLFLFFILSFAPFCYSSSLAGAPTLYFTDIINGQNNKNSDTSKGQTANVHGAFVTVYGVNLGSAQGI